MQEIKYPKVVVGALIFNRSGELLLIKQAKWKDGYAIPGGHVEWGEKMEDALIREILEETGLKIRNVKLLDVGEYILGNENTADKHFIFIDFTCDAYSSTVRLDQESSEYLWTKPKDSLTLPLVSATRDLIKKFLHGQGHKLL